ncbi:MAG: hypothetical protein KC468_32040, partial [Myxococcales bacterium]|nr:hypothetical protein [Myxococcales bacterium]
MTLDAHSGGAPIGYRRILQSRVDEFRARVTRENREMFAADRRRRRDATESLHVHVKTLIEDEFRAERLRSAREDERARAREVADRRSAVEQALVVETQRRLEVAREGLSARRALLDATRRDTGARAQATREYLNDE